MTSSLLFQGFGEEIADRFHLWYTLPWAFHEFVQISIPDKNISQLEAREPSRSPSILNSSRLVRMDLICNEVSPILARSSILSLKNVEELHLFFCNRDIDLKLPSLRHLNVISSLDALHRCPSMSLNIESITIMLRYGRNPYITGSWTTLRSLRFLPRLRSLRVVLYEFHMSADHPSCEIIAETAMRLVDFSFCFRRRDYFPDIDSATAFKRCCSFVEELRQKIDVLSRDDKPQCCVEKDGCGLMVWREQRYQGPAWTV